MIDGPPDAVWQVIMDPETLCKLSESCEQARRLDETRYEGVVRVKVPLRAFRAYVRGEVTRMQPPSSMTVVLEGHTDGLPGTFKGTAEIRLVAEGGRCRGRYVFAMDMWGKLGTIGQPFLASAAQRAASSFSDKVSAHLRRTRMGSR
jgi:carbon monoxide dehydrogenase subunit G